MSMMSSTPGYSAPTDFWKDTTVAASLPDGTNDFSEGISHRGTIHTGASSGGIGATGAYHQDIVTYEGNSYYQYQVITTNIPANSLLMPEIYIQGYNYGSGQDIDLAINFYTNTVPANSIFNTGWSSSGAKSPTSVRAGFNALGFLVLELTWPIAEYYQRYRISAFCAGIGPQNLNSAFQGWTVSNAGVFDATITNIVTFPRRTVDIAACPAPMTRAALLALRTAGSLRTECLYTITDYVSGRLVAGTRIMLHAVSATQLSENVEVMTTYDNEAWAGRYDIDANTIIELTDNRNNRVTSISLNGVGSFDWGNTAYTNCNLEHSTFTLTYGATSTVSNLRASGAASIDLTNFVGSLTNVTIEQGATVNLNAANSLSLNKVTVGVGAALNASSLAAAGCSLTNVEIGTTSTLNISTAQRIITISNSKLETGVTVNLSGATAGSAIISSTNFRSGSVTTHGPLAGNLTIDRSAIETQATLSHTGAGTCAINRSAITTLAVVSAAGAGSFTLFSVKVEDAANITHTSALPFVMNSDYVFGINTKVQVDFGQFSATGNQIGPYGRVLKTAATALALLSMSYNTISGAGSVQHGGSETMSLTGNHITSNSNISSVTGSALAGTFTANYNSLSGGSYINATATAIGGSLTVTNNQVSNGSYISKTGAGSLTADYCTIAGGGRVILSGVRDLILGTTIVNSLGTLYADALAGAGVTDRCNYSSITDYATLRFTASGAATNRIDYSSIRGYNGAMVFLGTNTGAYLTRCIADNGSITFDSNTVPMGTVLAIAARDGGSININNCSAAQDIRWSTVTSGGVWTLAGRTVAAPSYYHTIDNDGRLTQTATAAGAYRVAVKTGTIAHNGGILNVAIKEMSGTLTTGLFNHTDIQHRVAATKPLTASNNAKADYQGLTAQLV